MLRFNNTINQNSISVQEHVSSPSTPATGNVVLYAKADGFLYSKDDAGVETQLGGGGGSGTVTSVAATQPSAGFTITGSPITTSGTLVFTLADDLAGVEGLATNGIATRTATNTWTTRTVTGTTNRITLTNGDGVAGNPTVDIAATYVGQSSITTLGTITTGVWNGTTIAVANGGTGQTTANGALNAFLPSQAGHSGEFLTTNGTNASWSATSGSTALSSVTAATTSNSINNGNNPQTWNWNLSAATIAGLRLTENVASTGGAGSQFLFDVGTIASSTANPFRVSARGTSVINMLNTGALSLTAIGTGITINDSSSTNGVLFNNIPVNVSGGQLIVNTSPVAITSAAGGITTLGIQPGTQLGSAAGVIVAITGGQAGPSGNNGGAVNITGGTGTVAGNLGGAVNITGGQNTAGPGAGGAVSMIGGAGGGGSAAGGEATLAGGAGVSSGAGGNVNIIGGNSPSGTDGSIILTTASTERFRINGTGAWLLASNAGTAGQVLTSNGTGTPPTWQAGGGGGGLTISDDTSTNATRYLTFTSATTGSITTANVSSTKLFFNPSTGTLSATSFNSLSDLNFKTNIKKIETPVETLKKIDGVEFEWRLTHEKSYGVIAQKLHEVLPELVDTTNPNAWTVNYNGIVPFLIEAVKELSRVQQEQQRIIEQLMASK